MQDYRCTYTGIKLIPALNASIDHKIPLSTDVSQYQKIENLQWVCLDINIMKRNHSEDDFLKYIKLIYENRFWAWTVDYTGGDDVRLACKQSSAKPEANESLVRW